MRCNGVSRTRKGFSSAVVYSVGQHKLTMSPLTTHVVKHLNILAANAERRTALLEGVKWLMKFIIETCFFYSLWILSQ